jgi:hypothetical protein
MVKVRIHTFIWDSPEGTIIAEVADENFEWDKFWYHYGEGLDAILEEMPNVLAILDFAKP